MKEKFLFAKNFLVSNFKKHKLFYTITAIVLILFLLLLAFTYWQNPKEEGQKISVFKRITTSLKKEKVETPKNNNSQNSNTGQTTATADGQINNESNDNSTEPSGDSDNPEPTPTPPEEEPISAFVGFYADSQSDTNEEDAIHQTVVDELLASGANPIFHAGDLMEDGTQASFDRFNAVAGTLLGSRSFYPALGNNDREFGDSGTPSHLFLEQFGLGQWYSLNTGNLHIVVLDSAFAGASPAQLAWLDSDLKSAESQNRITGVMFHHPSFVSTINSYLVNDGADFVIDGHTHSYSQYTSDGIYYFTLPGGGSLGYALANIYTTRGEMYIYDTYGGLIGSASFNNR